MKAIHATPQSVDAIFKQYEFIIPVYQRPYSWGTEQCDKLWEDISSFCAGVPDPQDGYFLGSIVVYPHPDKKEVWSIIDGQQRLTTLMLLIRALFEKAGLKTVLQKRLYKENPDTGDVSEDELRLESRVHPGDGRNDYRDLKKVMRLDFSGMDAKNPFKVNYEHLAGLLGEWWQSVSSPEQREQFINAFLRNVVLLPIECASEEDALKLFEIVNDRGMRLTDADIFKAKIYRAVDEGRRDSFIGRWKAMSEHGDLFRVFMHISRAKRGDVSKESALRGYMDKHHLGDQKKLKGQWESIVGELEAIHTAWSDFVCTDKKIQYEENILWAILSTVPNVYWQYPVFVFQNKHGKFQGENFRIAEERQDDYIALLEAVIRYFFIKGVVLSYGSRLRDPIFKTCKTIAEEGDYLAVLKESVTDEDLENFHSKVADSEYGRYQRGLVYLNASLNGRQNRKAYSGFFDDERCQIEHILPRQWANYDQWDEDSHSESVGKIGNLIPLERRLNIRASNEFFQRKQKEYTESKVQDALDLADAGAWKHWYSEDVEKRQKESLARLRKFFDAIKK